MRIAIYDIATEKVVQEIDATPRRIAANLRKLAPGLSFLELRPGQVALGKCIRDGKIIDPPPCPDRALRAIRIEAQRRLEASDYTQHPDTEPDTKRWARYRRALRRAKKTKDPLNEVLPKSPDEEDT